MICPNCGGQTKVPMTMPNDASVQRQRKCKRCGHVFYTSETISDGKEFKMLRHEYYCGAENSKGETE